MYCLLIILAFTFQTMVAMRLPEHIVSAYGDDDVEVVKSYIEECSLDSPILPHCLSYATYMGASKIAEYLIVTHGENIKRFQHEYLFFHRAIAARSAPMVRLFLAHKFSLVERNFRRQTPLDFAREKFHIVGVDDEPKSSYWLMPEYEIYDLIARAGHDPRYGVE